METAATFEHEAPFDPPPARSRVRPERIVDAAAAEWERTYAMCLHLSLLLVHFLMPVVPALVMWLVKRDRSPFVDDHGREAINFQVSLVLYGLAAVPLMLFCGLGAVVLIGAYVLGIVGMILAAIAAQRGEYFRYPATIRFLH
jgi:uncharacterized Tic20 family protein